MKKIIYAITIVAMVSTSFLSCNSKAKIDAQNVESSTVIDAAHNSQNSLNWKGIYAGIIPCADCEGISVQIQVEDSTYVVNYSYLGKKKANNVQWSGKFTWDESGSVIKLDDKNLPPYYKVGENKLTQLDMEGNVIDGQHADMYILHKQTEVSTPK
jgi:uncharacterized lipoprotein NlpE involved in copper resistance